MPVQPNQLPEASSLWERFDYKPLTGELVRKITMQGRGNKNTKVGAPNSGGYYRVLLDGKSHARSRVTWKWITGKDPERFLDHINRNRGDDRAWNLREVDEAGNMLNRSAYGQSVVKYANRWLVLRRVNGQTFRATFNTQSEANHYAADLDSRMDAVRRELPNGRQIRIIS